MDFVQRKCGKSSLYMKWCQCFLLFFDFCCCDFCFWFRKFASVFIKLQNETMPKLIILFFSFAVCLLVQYRRKCFSTFYFVCIFFLSERKSISWAMDYKIDPDEISSILCVFCKYNKYESPTPKSKRIKSITADDDDDDDDNVNELMISICIFLHSLLSYFLDWLRHNCRHLFGMNKNFIHHLNQFIVGVVNQFCGFTMWSWWHSSFQNHENATSVTTTTCHVSYAGHEGT